MGICFLQNLNRAFYAGARCAELFSLYYAGSAVKIKTVKHDASFFCYFDISFNRSNNIIKFGSQLFTVRNFVFKKILRKLYLNKVRIQFLKRYFHNFKSLKALQRVAAI